MPELTLILSEKFNNEHTTRVRAELQRHVRVGQPQRLALRAFDPPSVMNSRDPSQLVACLATFLVRVDEISHTAEGVLKRGHQPAGPFLVKITETGTVTLSWMDVSSLKTYEEDIH